jgi:hypothetical protein
MPALFFPNLDALRLALVSGLVPAAVVRAPTRAGFDTYGHLWLESETALPREALTALGRLGVIALGSPGVETNPVRCWAELLPLRRAEPPTTGTVLFDVPDRRLAALVARLHRTRETGVGVRLLGEPHADRSWVTVGAPPTAVLLWLDGDGPDARAYFRQADGVWTLRGWEHPLAAHLSVPDGTVLLCDPDRGAVCVAGPVPEPRSEELPLRPSRVAPRGPRSTPRVGVPFYLVKRGARNETLWLLAPPDRPAFERFCRAADERLLRRFQVAEVSAGADARVLVRRADATDGAAVLPVPAPAYQCDPRLASLFVPAGYALRPVIRVHELARELGVGAERLVWVEPVADGGVAIHTVAVAAFRPLHEQVEYAAPPPAALAVRTAPEDPFAFDRFGLQVETSIEIDAEPEPAEPETDLPDLEPGGTAGEPSWVSKSVARMVRWVRGRRDRTEPSDPTAAAGPPLPDPRRAPTGGAPESGRVGRTLASADALLHGHDWSARRHELESRLLADSPQLDAEARATRWAELAGVYSATGQALDAAVCWTNALWECPTPPEEWLEQWALAECRAAKRGDRGADLERWLGEPGRPGTGRVVAALVAHFGFQSAPPAPEFLAMLPRVLAVLEQQFDDIPVRGAWLARLAVARSCDGDVLGLARWRDRLVRRLHERGPALDLDEPSFLRFRNTATAERFKTAREWLVRMHDPILRWVRGHARDGRGLEWAGLDGEGDATAAYAQFLLAWGLGALGERARAREWAAKARKVLAGTTGVRADPAGHALLGDLFLHRIREAHEGRVPKPVLPADLQTRLERLPEFARYSVDRLREHCRVLQPLGSVRAYRGRDLREFWGPDLLGERLSLLGARTDPAQLDEEARALLAAAGAEPSTTTVPRIAFALLEVAAALEPAVLGPLFELVPTALDWTETWVQAGRWTDTERADRVARFQARMIETAFAVAPPEGAQRLLRHVTHGAASGALLPATTSAAPRAFRSARKHALVAEAEALVHVLDPARADPAGPVTAERVGLATGWFVAGNEENGNRILNAARDALFYTKTDDLPQRTAVAVAYAEALGFAPAGIALGRLEELFQRLTGVTVQGSTNCYFTLHPLRLIDTVVRAVVTDEFTLGPAVRAWLDGDEFLIRRRIHRDMAALLRESELE